MDRGNSAENCQCKRSNGLCSLAQPSFLPAAAMADVGRAHSTIIEYFGADGRRLLKLKAPRRSDETGLSFAGAVFESRIVARVRIISGDTPIGADAFDNVKGRVHKHDIVAMDDFMYGE